MFESKTDSFKKRVDLTQKFEKLKRLAAKVTELNDTVCDSTDEGKRQTALEDMRKIRDECVRICKEDKFLMPTFRDRNNFIIDL